MARTTDRLDFPPLTPPAAPSPAARIPTTTIECTAGGAILRATLAVPADAVAIAVVLHDAADEHLDPTQAALIDMLHDAGVATLRADLCTADEARGDHANGTPYFDINLLVDRLLAVVAAIRTRAELQHLPLGVVGDRAVAAAALYAAAEYPEHVGAVVTRSARPDLAGPFFPRLAAPTLLIVGDRDPETRRINEEAFRYLQGPRSLEVIPEATHQFLEPGVREHAAVLTRAWLMRHLCPPQAADQP
jgi:dienelactone hydrolase